MTETVIPAPFDATVAHIVASRGTHVEKGATLLFLEIMKMEQPVTTGVAGTVARVEVKVGDQISQGATLVVIDSAATTAAPQSVDPGGDQDTGSGRATAGTAPPAPAAPDVDHSEPSELRADLAEVYRRRHLLTDDARPDVVTKRHDRGHRTARENIADLVDPGSFNELGGLATAAQRSRRSHKELTTRTPADGLVMGTATVNRDQFGAARSRVAVAAYDYTVLAGTQGWTNHRKLDRLFRLADEHGLPVVLFAEGGGGRPGDDYLGASLLDSEAFELFARLSGKVPLIAVVNGRCFAGNAALAGTADVIIATYGSSLGMAGPAMIEGGGLGVVHPDEVGPMEVQTANGVVDILVADEAAAVRAAAHYLSLTQGPLPATAPHDQTALRDIVPENRKRVYDMSAVARTLGDRGTLLTLRPDHATGMLTAFARIGGRATGILANVPTHLGGAIDAEGADSATLHLELCQSYGLPVLVLCDTPGFMVGPEAERDGGVRRFSRMFLAGAKLTVPVIVVVTRKGYGLGAQAMFGGHLNVPLMTLGWPTAELGPMGLEGAVALGYRRELDAIEDPSARAARQEELVTQAYATASGLNVASYGELDDVIDPADTRHRILQALDAAGTPGA